MKAYIVSMDSRVPDIYEVELPDKFKNGRLNIYPSFESALKAKCMQEVFDAMKREAEEDGKWIHIMRICKP